MMRYGAQKPTLDHRDRDFLKSFQFAGTTAPSFPEVYDTDAHLWMPNQNSVNPEFPKGEPQPTGCTNFTSADLSSDLVGELHDPELLELITHANAKGGYQIRDSLLAAKRIGWITGFYNIQAYAPLDYFDAIRLAQFSGLPEKRSVSVGTPWYPEWQNAAVQKKSVVPMPSSLNYFGLSWHNWKIAGWHTVNGIPFLRGKVWEGSGIGMGGWLDFDRHTINAVMALKYTIAFTATHATPTTIHTIDLALLDTFASKLKTLFGLRY